MAARHSTIGIAPHLPGVDSGVYLITCLANGKVYVGSSGDIRKRWWQHRSSLVLRKHRSILFQRTWDKYGPDAFDWRVIEAVETGRLIEVEQRHIDAYRASHRDYGLNISPTAGSCRGRKMSAETKEKLAAANRGRRHSPETKAKMSAVGRGRRQSAKACEKKRQAMLGRFISQQTRDAVARSNRERVHSGGMFTKLSLDDAENIKEEARSGTTRKALRQRYGVSKATIRKIINDLIPSYRKGLQS